MLDLVRYVSPDEDLDDPIQDGIWGNEMSAYGYDDEDDDFSEDQAAELTVAAFALTRPTPAPPPSVVEPFAEPVVEIVKAKKKATTSKPVSVAKKTLTAKNAEPAKKTAPAGKPSKTNPSAPAKKTSPSRKAVPAKKAEPAKKQAPAPKKLLAKQVVAKKAANKAAQAKKKR
jgi:hypothetical protein